MTSPIAAAAAAVRTGRGLGFDLRELCRGAMLPDNSMAEISGPDSRPLPSIADLPQLDYALELLIDQLIALQPVDLHVSLKSLTTEYATGAIYREREPDKQPKYASYTPTALSHLCYFWNTKLPAHHQLPRSPGANLLWYAPPARHAMVQDIRSRLGSDRQVTLRLLTFDKTILRAVTSDVHSLDTGDMFAVARQLRKTIPMVRGLDASDCRLWSSWTWDTARMSVFFGEDRAGVRGVANLALSETKAHSWFTSGGVHIAGTTYWGWAPATNAHGRHVGSRVAERMVDAIWDAYAMREVILAALAKAKTIWIEGNSIPGFMRRFEIPMGILKDEYKRVDLFQLISRLYQVENSQPDIHPETRQQLREGLGRVLKLISEGGEVVR